MSPQNSDGSVSSQATVASTRRGGRGKWWAIGGAALVVVLAIAAVVAIPQILQAQRVAEYHEVMSQHDAVTAETHQLRAGTDRITVLYSLQFAEAGEFQADLNTLAGYSDHYFTEGDLAALGAANESLVTVLENEGLSEAEAETVARAKGAIEENGYTWQTGYLNLTPDAMELVVEVPEVSPPMRVPDDEVTDETVAEARAALDEVETLLAEAERSLEAAQARADALNNAVIGAFEPLSSSATSAPDQVDVVLEMYPNTDQGITTLLRDSALVAAASVWADLFTVDDLYLAVPMTDEGADDQVSFEVTDAWRSVIIANQLSNYSGAITAAWLQDRGGVEEVLRNFNPFLPFG